MAESPTILIADDDQALSSRLQRDIIGTRTSLLMRHQQQVMEWVATGKPNKQIADVLGVSPKTIEVYRAHMKMQATMLAELVRICLPLEQAETVDTPTD